MCADKSVSAGCGGGWLKVKVVGLLSLVVCPFFFLSFFFFFEGVLGFLFLSFLWWYVKWGQFNVQ